MPSFRNTYAIEDIITIFDEYFEGEIYETYSIISEDSSYRELNPLLIAIVWLVHNTALENRTADKEELINLVGDKLIEMQDVLLAFIDALFLLNGAEESNNEGSKPSTKKSKRVVGKTPGSK